MNTTKATATDIAPETFADTPLVAEGYDADTKIAFVVVLGLYSFGAFVLGWFAHAAFGGAV